MSTSASTALRVLVVDDSATVRATVADVLRAGVTGFDAVELHEAENGEEAMLLAHMASPHVIMMDVQMPRMDGLQALRAMKEDPALREVPIVMLTRMETPSDLAAALDAGAHDYLRKPFEPVELTARVAAAGRTGILMAQLRRLNAQLDRAASTDQLTGLANRREVDRVMQDTGLKPLAVALIDVDHFKAVNDTHGHDCGDEVLRIVADRLRRTLRDADVVGRWGGEEFVALLPGTDDQGAVRGCERVLAAVAAPLGLADGPTSVTISIGLAVTTDGQVPVTDLLRSADGALYRAKADGRNRVVVADDVRPA